MEQKADRQRREFLKKAATTAAGTTILSTTATGTALAGGRTTIEINDHTKHGNPVYYIIKVQDPYMRKESKANGGDNVSNNHSDGTSKATGHVNGGRDTFSFSTRIREIILEAENGQGGVTITCYGGWGYDGASGVNIWNDGKHIGGSDHEYKFTNKYGAIWSPGDGSLESNDYKDDGYAVGHVDGGHDHWDSNGRLKQLYVNMFNGYRFHYKRFDGKRW